MPPAKKPKPKQTYESASERLEEIINLLDSGEVALRTTMELLQEGTGLLEFCSTELEAVSTGIEELRLDQLVLRLGAKDS